MKKTILILASFGILIASSCSNEVRDENANDTMMTDTTMMDTSMMDSAVVDTTTMPPDTMRQN